MYQTIRSIAKNVLWADIGQVTVTFDEYAENIWMNCASWPVQKWSCPCSERRMYLSKWRMCRWRRKGRRVGELLDWRFPARQKKQTEEKRSQTRLHLHKVSDNNWTSSKINQIPMKTTDNRFPQASRECLSQCVCVDVTVACWCTVTHCSSLCNFHEMNSILQKQSTTPEEQWGATQMYESEGAVRDRWPGNTVRTQTSETDDRI